MRHHRGSAAPRLVETASQHLDEHAHVVTGAMRVLDGDAPVLGERAETQVVGRQLEPPREMPRAQAFADGQLTPGAARLRSEERPVERRVVGDEDAPIEQFAQFVDEVGETGCVAHVVIAQPVDMDGPGATAGSHERTPLALQAS